MDLSDALSYAHLIEKNIRLRTSFTSYIVGSIRRKMQKIKDIDILIVTPQYVDHIFDDMELVSRRLSVKKIVSRGDRRCRLIIEDDRNRHIIKCDLFYATKTELPFALLHHTGSKEYLQRIRYIAKCRGMILNQYGIYNRETNRELGKHMKTESDIQKYLNITERAPRDRV